MPLYAIGLIESNNEQRIVETADLSILKVPTDLRLYKISQGSGDQGYPGREDRRDICFQKV